MRPTHASVTLIFFFCRYSVKRSPSCACLEWRGRGCGGRGGGRPRRLLLNLEADLSGVSKQRLRRQVRVRVGPSQVGGAARGLDGHLVWGRGLQPRGRVRRRTETPGVHRRVVEVLPAAAVPVPLHRPALQETGRVGGGKKSTLSGNAHPHCEFQLVMDLIMEEEVHHMCAVILLAFQ